MYFPENTYQPFLEYFTYVQPIVKLEKKRSRSPRGSLSFFYFKLRLLGSGKCKYIQMVEITSQTRLSYTYIVKHHVTLEEEMHCHPSTDGNVSVQYDFLVLSYLSWALQLFQLDVFTATPEDFMWYLISVSPVVLGENLKLLRYQWHSSRVCNYLDLCYSNSYAFN